MVNIGVVFRPQQPPEELEAVVRAVDEAGVPELWLWEDCFLEGGMTTATAALAWSTRLRVGIGLLPVPLRNPAIVAMELATLERLWPRRLVPTLGHGVLDWMGQVGARVDSPMTLLREHAEAVRDLLEGRRVDVDGRYVRLDGVALDWPPTARPPLLVGARGERTIRLAGEVGDGVLLDSVTDPGTVRRARALVDEARAGSGRPGRAVVTAYTQVDPASPAAELAEQVAERVAVLAEAGADTVVLQGTGERPDPRPVVEALAAAGLVTGRVRSVATISRSEDLRGAELVDVDLRGARFVGADLSGAVMRGVDVQGADIDAPWLSEAGASLRVNGVEVAPLVDAELDRRFPGRAERRAESPEGLRAAWSAVEQTWTATLARVAAMPPGTVDASVDGEWSFAQTLRHLVMATDTWLGRAVLRLEAPYHPLGLPHGDYATDGHDTSIFTTRVPSYDEVLEARADRMAMVRDFLAAVTPDLMEEPRPAAWDPDHRMSVRECLHVVLNEEWEHHRFAVRDLDALTR